MIDEQKIETLDFEGKYLTFNLMDEFYGVSVDWILQIIAIPDITKIPKTPPFVKGVINLRGNVTPIIDLRCKLGFEQSDNTDQTRVIITKYENIELGLIVDQTSDVIDVDLDLIEAVSSAGFNSDYFSGIAKIEGRLIILLKLSELINSKTD